MPDPADERIDELLLERTAELPLERVAELPLERTAVELVEVRCTAGDMVLDAGAVLLCVRTAVLVREVVDPVALCERVVVVTLVLRVAVLRSLVLSTRVVAVLPVALLELRLAPVALTRSFVRTLLLPKVREASLVLRDETRVAVPRLSALTRLALRIVA